MGKGIGYLVIPKIAVNFVVVEGVGEPQLQGGPGHYPGTSLPGQPGNAAIAGHRTTYAAPFYNLNELTPGDPIYALTSQGLFRYNVVSQQAVAPTDVAVLDQSATPELTLTTCNPRWRGPAPRRRGQDAGEPDRETPAATAGDHSPGPSPWPATAPWPDRA